MVLDCTYGKLFCACGVLSTNTYTCKCTVDNRRRIDGLLDCVYVTHTFVLFILCPV